MHSLYFLLILPRSNSPWAGSCLVPRLPQLFPRKNNLKYKKLNFMYCYIVRVDNMIPYFQKSTLYGITAYK